MLQSLQSTEQGGLDVTVVLLVVDLSRSHRQNILVMQLVEFDRSLDVTLFDLDAPFIWAQKRSFKSQWQETRDLKSAVNLKPILIREVGTIRISHLYLPPGTSS